MSIRILPQEVSRCRTRGKSDKSIAHRWQNIQVRHQLCLCHQESSTGVSVAPQKRTDVLPKFNNKILPYCNNTQDHFQKACVLLLGTCVAPHRLLCTSTCRPQVHWKIWAARGNVMVLRGCIPFPARSKHDIVTGLHMLVRKMMLQVGYG